MTRNRKTGHCKRFSVSQTKNEQIDMHMYEKNLLLFNLWSYVLMLLLAVLF